MGIRIAKDSDREQWNQFVDREGGSFYQYYDWKFVYEFKKKNCFIPLLIQDNNSDIMGIFSLVEQKGLRFYPWLLSLPEGATGGFLLSNSLSDEEKKRNLNLFFAFIDEKYSRTHSLITLKEQIPIENGANEPTQLLLDNRYEWLDTRSTALPCTHYLKLETPFEEKIWRGLWSKRLRKRIRHTQKAGLSVIVDNELQYLDTFVDLYYDSVKKFGVTAEKDTLFQIFKVFQHRIKLFIGLLDFQPISAALCFYTPTTAYLSKAPYLPVAGDYLTNTLPIHSSIQYACDSGYRYYEMGITMTQELAFHKEKFATTRIPMRVYTKEFSHFKVIANKTCGDTIVIGKKLTGLLR